MSSKPDKWPPVHPGEILLHEFLEPLDLSQSQLAKDIGVPSKRINELVHGKRDISGEMALRLGRYFGTSAELWMGLQTHYELDVAQDEFEDRLEREVAVRAA